MTESVSGPVLVHATSVALGAAAAPFGGPPDIAVLLLGDSGSGKSDLALRLIAAGARLIADDQTLLSLENDRLVAAAPQRLAGLFEVRGVGILELDCAGPAPVALAVQLQDAAPERLPEPRLFRPPGLALPTPPPLIALNPFESSAPAKVAAAASAAALGRFRAGAGAVDDG